MNKSCNLHIYTDGSHIKGTNVKGYGAWCEHEGKEYWISQCCNSIKTVSNPTMELMACCKVLETFQGCQVHMLIYIDYIGVSRWIQGRWAAKKPYIKVLVDRCKEYIKTIDGIITFVDVPAHSGIKGNEKADEAAKSGKNINTFIELRKIIM